MKFEFDGCKDVPAIELVPGFLQPKQMIGAVIFVAWNRLPGDPRRPTERPLTERPLTYAGEGLSRVARLIEF